MVVRAVESASIPSNKSLTLLAELQAKAAGRILSDSWPCGARALVFVMEMDKLVALCRRRGFLFQSSEMYGGLNGFWDYGPPGALESLVAELRERNGGY